MEEKRAVDSVRQHFRQHHGKRSIQRQLSQEQSQLLHIQCHFGCLRGYSKTEQEDVGTLLYQETQLLCTESKVESESHSYATTNTISEFEKGHQWRL